MTQTDNTRYSKQYPLFKTIPALQNNAIHHLKPTIPALQNNIRSSKQCHSPPQTKNTCPSKQYPALQNNTRSSKQYPLFKTMPLTTSNRQYPLFKTMSALQNNAIHQLTSVQHFLWTYKLDYLYSSSCIVIICMTCFRVVLFVLVCVSVCI